MGSWWGACFFLGLIFCLSLSLSLMLSKIKLILKKQGPLVCCLVDAHLRPIDNSRLKVRGWKIIYHENGYEKKAGGPILILGTQDLKPNPGVTWWLSTCTSAFSSRCVFGIPGSSPTSASHWGASLPQPKFLSLLLCVSLMHK